MISTGASRAVLEKLVLSKVTFQNFKALRDVAVPLSPFTVLVGSNGVGKSSVLDGIHLMTRLLGPAGVEDAMFGPVMRWKEGDSGHGRLLSHGRETLGIELEERGGSRLGVVAQTQRGEVKAVTYTLRTSSSDRTVTMPADPFANPSTLLQVKPFPANLSSTARLRLEARLIMLRSPGELPGMLETGFGFPNLLADVILASDDNRRGIVEMMAGLVPGFKGVFSSREKWIEPRFETLKVEDQEVLRAKSVEVSGFTFSAEIYGGRVPAAHISEGTLLALAIVTLLHSPSRPRLLLLDDVDRALHPRAQLAFVDMLKKIVRANDGLQILTTAHSDTALMGCAPEEIIRLEPDEDGYATLRPVQGDPRWMSSAEIDELWFDVSRTSLDELLQRYAFLAGDARRTDEEEARLNEMERELVAMGARRLPTRRPRKP